MKNIEFPSLIIGAMRLGSWGAKMNSSQLESFVHGCLDLGFYAFDHADIYGDYSTENDFGKVLKNNSSLRSKVHLLTKCGIRLACDNRPEYLINSYDSHANHIMESVDNSLVNFNTDYLDTLLVHRPDYLMDPDEIVKAFVLLKESGKVRNFGVSNFSTSQFNLLNNSFKLVTNQIEVSLLRTEALDDGTLDQCMLNGIQPMAWSPVAGGALFQRNGDVMVDRVLAVCNKLCELYSCSIDELLYAWLFIHPARIIPVTGTSKLERIKLAHRSLSIRMSKEHWYVLLEASRGEAVP